MFGRARNVMQRLSRSLDIATELACSRQRGPSARQFKYPVLHADQEEDFMRPPDQ